MGFHRSSSPVDSSGARRKHTREPQTGNSTVESGHRFYNPDTGRWLNRDPIEEEGGISLYVIAKNDAINAFDILGERPASVSSGSPSELTLAIDRAVTDTTGSDITKDSGYYDLLVLMQSSSASVPLVTNPHGQNLYDYKKGVISTPGGSIATHTAIHEMSHYLSHTSHGFPFGIWPSSRREEGMAYANEAAYRIFFESTTNLRVLEGLLDDGVDRGLFCSDIEKSFRSGWPSFWRSFGKPRDTGGVTYQVLGWKRHTTLDSADYSNISTYFGVNISCQRIADSFNDKLTSRGCCFRVSCTAAPSLGLPSSSFEIPAGTSIDAVFR